MRKQLYSLIYDNPPANEIIRAEQHLGETFYELRKLCHISRKISKHIIDSNITRHDYPNNDQKGFICKECSCYINTDEDYNNVTAAVEIEHSKDCIVNAASKIWYRDEEEN